MASTHLRSSSSFPNLLLTTINFLLFLLSTASLLPTFLLRAPPTAFGWALFATSALTLLSSFLGFYYRLTYCCLLSHLFFLLASLMGQALGFLALFWREAQCIRAVGSPRDPREAKLLIRMECFAFLCMFVLQMVVLVLICAVQSCWVREYHGLEVEKAETDKKRSRRSMTRVQEEPLAKMADQNDAEDKMMSKI